MAKIYPRPVEGQCPVCQTIFPHPVRKQGGGALKKFCSPKCRSLDWTQGNSGKRKASVTKYDVRPANKEQKARRNRATKLRKYGWSEVEFQHQLQRQNFSCYGCLSPLNETSARVDHDHINSRVRGLLCDSCNWGLGHLNDSPVILRRLMAYLDYQRERTCVYITGALKNPRVPELGNRLRALGFDVMDEWFTPGEFADTNWQAYEKQRGRTYEEALRGRAATNIFLFDRSYLDLADVVILLMPAGKSSMLELGYAKGRNKYTCILLDGEDPDRYDVMPNFADKVFQTEDALIGGLPRPYGIGVLP